VVADPGFRLLPSYAPTKRLARVLGGLLAAVAALCWLDIGHDATQLRLIYLRESGGGVGAAEFEAHLRLGARLAAIELALFLATAAAFSAWLSTARANCRAFGARRLVYGQAWATLGFWVPLLNLIRPYQVIREVWQASDPSETSPLHWKELAPSPLLPWWWGSFVACMLLQIFAGLSALGTPDSPRRLAFAAGLALVADLLTAVAASLAYFVVSGISAAQGEKQAKLQRTAQS
jgi:hypothetical protein